jgi:hypothetical protein
LGGVDNTGNFGSKACIGTGQLASILAIVDFFDGIIIACSAEVEVQFPEKI